MRYLLSIIITLLLAATSCSDERKEYEGGYYSGTIYEGKPQGYGRWESKDGKSWYEGYWHKGKRSGAGVLLIGKTRYEGEFLNGLYDGYGVLLVNGKEVYSGTWQQGRRCGMGETCDSIGNTARAIFNADTIVSGTISYADRTFSGKISQNITPRKEGLLCFPDGSAFIGCVEKELKEGKGLMLHTSGDTEMGTWSKDGFLGTRLLFSHAMVYGIDISRHQHEQKGESYTIDWDTLRITSLGQQTKKDIKGSVNYPVSFIFIKVTEGATVLNAYYDDDYLQAKTHGYTCGSYHFFSTTSTANEQASHFLRNVRYEPGDLPPVLDVEPSDAQIAALGGAKRLHSTVSLWLKQVEKALGVKPILYVSQRFINTYLNNWGSMSKDYPLWVARYNSYSPDKKQMFWQLGQDGKVRGIHGDVDINVYYSSKEEFARYMNENKK